MRAVRVTHRAHRQTDALMPPRAAALRVRLEHTGALHRLRASIRAEVAAALGGGPVYGCVCRFTTAGEGAPAA